mmetsp:Transcript_24754/g.62128  ORF Transcript_24754/g.62128 Transcript_24754/m.62128 type:complete len:202 (-) Transcript_24754:172-777(-)
MGTYSATGAKLSLASAYQLTISASPKEPEAKAQTITTGGSSSRPTDTGSAELKERAVIERMIVITAKEVTRCLVSKTLLNTATAKLQTANIETSIASAKHQVSRSLRSYTAIIIVAANMANKASVITTTSTRRCSCMREKIASAKTHCRKGRTVSTSRVSALSAPASEIRIETTATGTQGTASPSLRASLSKTMRTVMVLT